MPSARRAERVGDLSGKSLRSGRYLLRFAFGLRWMHGRVRVLFVGD
jgi:hypothetical protein